jgi:hypothetical protein
MTTEVEPAAPAVYAPRTVIETIRGAFMARAMYAVVVLHIADALAAGPRRCVDLADELFLQPIPLNQVLRAVASTGLLQTLPGSEIGPLVSYALTPLGETLREDHPSGTRDIILTLQGPTVQSAVAVLPQRLSSTCTGPELALGAPFFDHLRDNPGEAAAFDRMMIAIHGGESAAVAAGYDFSWATSIVDVGGGLGGFLLTLLRVHPHLHGMVAELPQVAARAREHLAAQKMDHRCTAVAADFFVSVPPGADAYLLSYVLHNWDDESCVTILRSCAAAMPERGRLLVVETVLPPDDRPHQGKLLDLVMVTLTRGVERSTLEYSRLAERAGLRVAETIPTDSPVSILELVHAG